MFKENIRVNIISCMPLKIVSVGFIDKWITSIYKGKRAEQLPQLQL